MTRSVLGRTACATLAAAAAAPLAAAQPCVWEWNDVGGGTDTPGPGAPYVQASVVWDDGLGGGPALYVGGAFTTAGGIPANKIAKWDGHSWSPLGSGTGGGAQSVLDMAVWDDGLGAGPSLYVVGAFMTAGGIAAPKVARWDGANWHPVGAGMPVPTDYVYAIAPFGDSLYVGGRFTQVGDATINRLARWDGANWHPVGLNDIDLEIYELTVFDDGTGPALYVGGHLDVAGGIPVNNIAKWDGQNWHALGEGVLGPSPNGLVNGAVLAMAVFDDDGPGPIPPALYVGGDFDTAGGQPAFYIARWDGQNWTPVGGGMNDRVATLTVFDDGTGPALYAGGYFTTAGGVPVNGIAKWDGQSWHPVGAGMTEFAEEPAMLSVLTLAGFDDGFGSGRSLYAGGAFSTAGGLPISNIARWSCNPVGACCLPSGACDLLTEQGCALAGGVYYGDGVDCASIPPCPQPATGACCLPDGSCEIMWAGGCAELGGIYQGDDTACGDCPAFYTEVEPNNSKFEANALVPSSGDVITGVSTAADGVGDPDSPDYFRIQTAAAPRAIYRHQMTLTSPTPGHLPTIRLRLQQNNPGSWPCDLGQEVFQGFDFIGQEPVAGPQGLVNTWYGFGRQEFVYYRVDGAANTVDGYQARFETTTITPIDLGDFQPGQIIIDTSGQGHETDTVLAIYDADLNAIPGYFNDNATLLGGAPADSIFTSYLRRDFAPGVYYLAIGRGTIATDQGIPCDEGELFYVLADSPNVLYVVDNDFSTSTNASFSITDGAGTTPVPAEIPGRNQLAWFTFTVGGGAACPADWDGDQQVNSNDISAFLTSWLDSVQNGALEADFDGSGSVNSNDISAFLTAWLDAVGSGC